VQQEIDERRGMDVKAADLGTPDKVTQHIDQTAEVAARNISNAALAAAAAAAQAELTGELADDVIEGNILVGSDAAALRVGAMVTSMLDQGRSDEASDSWSDIDHAEYSAILDGQVCATCEQMDGQTTTDPDEADGWVPNPDCEGGDRCRCAVFYLMK
jgi:hypothetical protein